MINNSSDQPSGIQDLDYPDDLAVLSTKYSHLRDKANRLAYQGPRPRFCTSTRHPVPLSSFMVRNWSLLLGVYLGNVISKDDGTHKDIKVSLGQAIGVFSILRSICRSKQYSLKTKIQLYKMNRNLNSVFLYGSECWRVTKKDISEVEAFHNGCLRKIYNIFWPSKTSNRGLYEKAGCHSIVMEIKKRRLRWLGHVLRMPQERIPQSALMDTTRGRESKGGQKQHD